MSLLNHLLFEIEKSGGIAKMYEVACLELISDKKDFENDDDYWARKKTIVTRKYQSIMNLTTGTVYKSASHAARSANIPVRYFQDSIRNTGTYLTFIKVA